MSLESISKGNRHITVKHGITVHLLVSIQNVIIGPTFSATPNHLYRFFQFLDFIPMPNIVIEPERSMLRYGWLQIGNLLVIGLISIGQTRFRG